MLGVCLGHQAICEAFGGEVTYANQVMHGKSSFIELDDRCPLFNDITSPAQVGRYHSLAADANTLPSCLMVTARSEDGEAMAVQHTEHPTFGLQFRPESILTSDGTAMARAFVSVARSSQARLLT